MSKEKTMADEAKKVDLVFEGGGIKGIGLVGAYSVLEQQGWKPNNIAGTSAGAIVGSLIAAGYTATEMKAIIDKLDFSRFKDKGIIDSIPLVGPLISLLLEKGVYEGDFVERWIGDLLREKGVRFFGDLRGDVQEGGQHIYRLNIITSDITNEKMVVLPQGIAGYGLEPERLEVAKAVRMSTSIPIFFEPVIVSRAYFVDGGILSNFPIWLFDSKELPAWPTFGIKLIEPDYGRPNKIEGPIDFIRALIATMMEAQDKIHVEDDEIPRTIRVSTGNIQTTDFDIGRQEIENLYKRGVKAAQDFLSEWDFERYKAEHRKVPNAKWEAKVKKLKQQLVI
jgi:NTE family protein